MTELIDISPTLHSGIAVWPGDTPLSRDVLMSIDSSHLELSTLRTTVHVGAHADAPVHYHRDGQGMSERDLSYYLGSAEVVEVNVALGERVLPSHLKAPIQSPRVLFKTGSFPDSDQFNRDFNSLSPELIDMLAEQGVVLVGIDTPSIDPFSSKKMESHLSVYRHDLAVLEGLVLKSVDPGLYNLIALPLKLKDADASPVRALLIKGESDLLSSILPAKLKA